MYPYQRLPKPVIVPVLVAVNLFVLIYSTLEEMAAGKPWITLDWGFTPSKLSESLLNLSFSDFGHNVLTLFSYAFIHANLEHWFGNMLFLLLFGTAVEGALGRIRFSAYYLIFGALAALAHYAVYPVNALPMIGASGAVAGCMGAMVALAITGRFGFHPLALAGSLFAVIWLLGEFAGFHAPGSDRQGIAFMAHIGGFLAGFPIALIWGLKRTLKERRARRRADDERRLNELRFRSIENMGGDAFGSMDQKQTQVDPGHQDQDETGSNDQSRAKPQGDAGEADESKA